METNQLYFPISPNPVTNLGRRVEMIQSQYLDFVTKEGRMLFQVTTINQFDEPITGAGFTTEVLELLSNNVFVDENGFPVTTPDPDPEVEPLIVDTYPQFTFWFTKFQTDGVVAGLGQIVSVMDTQLKFN